MEPSQKAFQEFMLRGKGASSCRAPSTPKTSTKQRRKAVGPVFKALQGRLEEWKDIDDQLQAILNSIANLRDRIGWECRHQESTRKESLNPWQDFGFRSEGMFLYDSDVERALAHDLLQHEKMLAGARTLITSLAQAHEALGRRLEEWLLLGLEEALAPHSLLVIKTEQVCLFLASELYRKQMLVQTILDSSHDGLVVKESPQSLVEGNPGKVARRCCDEWLCRRREEWLEVEKLLRMSSTCL